MEIDANEPPPDKINNILSELFKFINIDKANDFIKNFILSELSLNPNVDIVLRNILKNFAILLSWPLNPDIDIWFIGLMKLIASCAKYSILIEFCEEELDHVSFKFFFKILI